MSPVNRERGAAILGDADSESGGVGQGEGGSDVR